MRLDRQVDLIGFYSWARKVFCMDLSTVVLLVEQIVAGTVVLLLVIFGIAAVLFRAAAGDVLQGTTGTRVSEGEALGVIVDGTPGPLYGPGRHQIDPTTDESVQDGIEDWETVRFTTGRTTFGWSHVDVDEQTDVEITMTVRDPDRVWEQARDPGQPVRDVLTQLLEDATVDGTELVALTAAGINDAATVDYGLSIDRLSVEQSPRENVEVDGLDKLA